MKPSDHPDFFRFPAPEGRSRESTLRLDARGRFWHDGAPVDHPRLAGALHAWMSRHPDDGRYILTNGYDWTYVTVDDAPFFVRAIRLDAGRIVLDLSDGSSEPWEPETSRVGPDGALYARVKSGARGGPYEAKFTPHAQASLAPWLVEAGGGDGGAPGVGVGVRIGGRVAFIGSAAGPSRREDR
jgi:hypothetical protein